MTAYPNPHTTMRFLHKTALVTGGTSGIGRATCLRLAAEGARVAVLGRDAAEGAEVVATIRQAHGPGRAAFYRCDLARPAQIARAVARILTDFGHLDVLVSNAAVMTYLPLQQLPLPEWDNVLNVNLRAFAQLCQLCLPAMPAGSAIVAVSSVHAHQTTPGVAPYAASKAALEALVRALSRELAPAQTRINAVAPGAIDTPMLWNNPNVKNGTEKIEGAIGQPHDVAAAIAFLASAEATFIHGTTLVVDGGRLAQL